MASNHQFHPALSGIAVDIGKNAREDYVADCLYTPVNVCGPRFSYRVFDRSDSLVPISDLVTCESQVHEITCDGSTLAEAKIEAHALEKPVCVEDMLESDCGCGSERFDLLANAVEEITHKLLLNKELTILGSALDAANHTNVEDLTANGTLLDDPNTDVLALFRDKACDARFGYNSIMIGRKAKEKLRRHPKLFGNGCCNVLMSDEELAAVLGFANICCPRAYYDTTGLGVPAVLQNVIDDSILLFNKNSQFNSTTSSAPTFAFQATYTPRTVKNGGTARGESAPGFQVFVKDNDWNMGAYGGCRVRVVTNYKLIVPDYSQACLLINTLTP